MTENQVKKIRKLKEKMFRINKEKRDLRKRLVKLKKEYNKYKVKCWRINLIVNPVKLRLQIPTEEKK